jgi:YfiH family protein
MLKKKKNTVTWLEFELLKQFREISHGVFWNLPLGEKSDPSHFKTALEILELESLVKLKQCHKDDVLEVKGKGALLHFDDFDALVTNQRGVGLLIRHADCQAATFYDPVNKAIGNVHSGWRGSKLNIYKKVTNTMGKLYGTKPEDLIVCIGPSLGPNRAEFKHYKEELPESFWKHQIRPNYFDFWEISKEQLLELGILKNHIEIAKICTFDHGYSYRKDKKTPHHGTIIALSN